MCVSVPGTADPDDATGQEDPAVKVETSVHVNSNGGTTIESDLEVFPLQEEETSGSIGQPGPPGPAGPVGPPGQAAGKLLWYSS